MSRIAQGWVPSKMGETHDSDDDSVCYSDVEGVTEENVNMAGNLVSVPLGLQQAVDSEARDRGAIWQQGVLGQAPAWPIDLGARLPSTSIARVRDACATFPIQVGLGWDKLHPRAVARCSDLVINALIALLVLAEMAGTWYGAVGVTLIALIPKSDGGRRPIRLFPSLVRIWMRIRLEIAQDWVREHERPYFYAGHCKGADVAAWKQSLLAEASVTFSLPCICTLLDLVKAIDSVPFDELSECAARLRYNLCLLRLSIASYLLARVLQVGREGHRNWRCACYD